MSNENGEGMRVAFRELLDALGADYDVGGDQRRALKDTTLKEGFVVLRFAEEFPIQAGDRIREARSELHFDVVDSESNTCQGILASFDVTTERAS
jgi:hypothetical protein